MPESAAKEPDLGYAVEKSNQGLQGLFFVLIAYVICYEQY